MRQGEGMLYEARHPWPGGVHEASGSDRPALAAGEFLEDSGPELPIAACGDAARAGQDGSPPLSCVERVQRHQPRIVDAAIRIAEALGQRGLQCLARRITPQVQTARSRQQPSSAEMVIEEKTQPNEPGGAQRR